MFESQLASELPKKIGINCISLMEIDDLMKFIILDPYMGCSTRKMLPLKSFILENKINNEMIISKQKLLPKEKLHEVEDALKNFLNEQNLYYTFNIKYRSWVNVPMRFYLETITIESPVSIELCNRYNEKIGLKISAKVNISNNVKIRCLSGIYKQMSMQREQILAERNLNFSVIESSRIKAPVLMLGTAALVNHDCDPNCIYFTTSKSVIIILTIKNIRRGDELYCYYGKNYFGPNNEQCKCKTCEKNKNGFFKQVIDKESNGTSTSQSFNLSNGSMGAVPNLEDCSIESGHSSKLAASYKSSSSKSNENLPLFDQNSVTIRDDSSYNTDALKEILSSPNKTKFNKKEFVFEDSITISKFSDGIVYVPLISILHCSIN
ncbi:histone-lysine N-methyltransferase KMT5B-like [Phymastichus coffea]|uniref:histone-lysine N-methyltransferase KMT5B-like n=1 Tax=Phymastichus coffea TaxID=108790 RepID=UPI00273C30AF|nr:histone-lysine N-methyltransferase KMT5B-like [Phymastichus coffea]